MKIENENSHCPGSTAALYEANAWVQDELEPVPGRRSNGPKLPISGRSMGSTGLIRGEREDQQEVEVDAGCSTDGIARQDRETVTAGSVVRPEARGEIGGCVHADREERACPRSSTPPNPRRC